MVSKRDKKRFTLAVCSLLLLVPILLFASGCLSVTGAYVPESLLTDGWHENVLLRQRSSEFFGLEQTLTVTYKVQGQYPASLTVTTLKKMVLIDEEELPKKILDTVTTTVPERIILDVNPTFSGERISNVTRHRNLFFVFEGVDVQDVPSEHVYVIGEAWNCPQSGTSILCVGIAYVTNTVNNTAIWDTTHWRTIVMDPRGIIDGLEGVTGLIDHVICHE